MRRGAIIGAVVAVLVLSGCGERSPSDQADAEPAATATSDVDREHCRAMDELAVRLDGAVSGAIQGDANALAPINDVVRQIRTRLEDHGAASPAGQLLLTTAASARDYARRAGRASS
jgi:hypothetical protein